MEPGTQNPLVSVVMIFLDEEPFIQEAIESVLAQDYPHWELLLVDDGSGDRSAAIARAAAERLGPKARYLEHPGRENRGTGPSRNLGARHARGQYLAFLDADDVWLPSALGTAVRLLEAHPAAGMLYGNTERWRSWTGQPAGQEQDSQDHVAQIFGRPGSLAYPPELLRLFDREPYAVPCVCSLLVRRRLFEEIGGFEERFTGLFEDQAFYVKVCARSVVYVTGECWSRYRQHPASICAAAAREGQVEAARRDFRHWRQAYLQAQGIPPQDLEAARGAEGDHRRLEEAYASRLAELEGGKAWLEEQWRAWKGVAEERERSIAELKDWIEELERGKAWLAAELGRREQPGQGLLGRARRLGGLFRPAPDESRPAPGGEPAANAPAAPVQPEGGEQTPEGQPPPEPALPEREAAGWSPRGWPLQPVSRAWGFDRGLPVDRYYIEKFLQSRAPDIRGQVLEIGDRAYTTRFGGERVAVSDVLHVVEGNPQATLVGDLAAPGSLPPERFDCAILTQTLHLIYDLRLALQNLYRSLKPGGVLLATFPGISRLSVSEWPGSWHWGLTRHSAARLFAEVFPPGCLQVEAFGNVLAASAFLYGFAAGELRPEDLEHRDPEFDLLVAVRALKPAAEPELAASAELAAAAEPAASTETAPPPALRPEPPAAAGREPEGGPGAAILMYHRIGEAQTDPWALSVSLEHFEAHLQVLQKGYRVLRMEALVEALAAGELPPGAAALTFDDGYAHTLRLARPLLERCEIPATVFMPSGALRRGGEFWWDALARVLLEPGRLPPALELELGGQVFRRELGEAAFYPPEAFVQARRWRAWESPPGPRQQLYIDLWERLHPLEAGAREAALAQILDWAGQPAPPRPAYLPLTWDELQAHAAGPWVEFGSHGVSHSSLAALPAGAQAQELNESRAELERALGRPVHGLAYPYGNPVDCSEETVSQARLAGYRWACVVSARLARGGDDPFRLPRFTVLDWDGPTFERRLEQWLRPSGR